MFFLPTFAKAAHYYMLYFKHLDKGLHTSIWKAPMFLAEQENPGETAEEIREGEKEDHLTCT